MSAFLGPIHHWVFGKIKLHEDLEKELLAIFKNKYGSFIDELYVKMTNLYGAQLPDVPLEDLIDTSNIHGWLQSTIEKTETRQAAILKEIFEKYGDEAFNEAIAVYLKQGTECGKDAFSKNTLDTAPQIFKAINNYLIDGMPCDNSNQITENSDNRLEWKVTSCLHKDYWESVGADIHQFYKLRFSWIEAFVNAANPSFAYSYILDGGELPIFTHEIIRKIA